MERNGPSARCGLNAASVSVSVSVFFFCVCLSWVVLLSSYARSRARFFLSVCPLVCLSAVVGAHAFLGSLLFIVRSLARARPSASSVCSFVRPSSLLPLPCLTYSRFSPLASRLSRLVSRFLYARRPPSSFVLILVFRLRFPFPSICLSPFPSLARTYIHTYIHLRTYVRTYARTHARGLLFCAYTTQARCAATVHSAHGLAKLRFTSDAASSCVRAPVERVSLAARARCMYIYTWFLLLYARCTRGVSA